MRFQTFLFLLLNLNLFSQSNPDYKNYDFRSPLDIPLILAGNFAELRSNHFHTGIDIKTQGVEGHNIYSVEEGYISRIKISPWGYGKVIYVDHYNGFTSVYAHCQRFSERFENIMFNKMQKAKKNEMDAYFEKDELKVKKGEIIAISGNTGGSVAPHLHFEIRETKSERPVNPLLFNFKISDKRKPEIRGVKIYSLNEHNYIIPGKSKYHKCIQSGSAYKTEDPIKIDEGDFVVNGKVGIALDVIDRLDDANNICGIYSTKLSCNGIHIFAFNFEKLDFSTNRKINGHTDVYDFKKKRRNLHKLFSNPVTTLDNYESVQNGIDLKSLKDSNRLTILAEDQNKNSSKFISTVFFTKNAPLKFNFDNYLMPDSLFAYRSKDFELLIPQGTIFEPLKLDFEELDSKFTKQSKQYHFGDYQTPTNNKFRIRFNIKNYQQPDKLVICILNNQSNRYYSLGGELSDGWIEAYSKSFGDYFLKKDSLAPEISILNFSEGLNISAKRKLKVKIKDDLSGIKSYSVKVNNVFIPSYFHPRKSIIEIPVSKLKSTGKCQISIEVIDGVNNKLLKTINVIK